MNKYNKKINNRKIYNNKQTLSPQSTMSLSPTTAIAKIKLYRLAIAKEDQGPMSKQ